MLVEQRKSRKIFKVKAVLAVAGASPILVRTVDIGAAGMSVAVPGPLPVGLAATINFDLLVDGTSTPVSTAVKVGSCIFSSGDFKVSLSFSGLAPAASSALTRFLR
ncbi:PilZ domain-containing protein [Massilia cavernae]|uniref:PilZ domain-containing protein n=1 Tax=Massilia cavernae TaxID=2320864 RepID=A0A418XUE9_9BURK|nr:PilZ domain-containing protein [Massilia cavernae]RJG16317.1 PilZ domain-containing protein [Massilia cavernae]